MTSSSNWLLEVEYFVCSGGGMKGLLVAGALTVLEFLWKDRGGLHCIKGLGGVSVSFFAKTCPIRFHHLCRVHEQPTDRRRSLL